MNVFISLSPTSAMISKVKGQDRKVTWSVWQMLACKSRRKSSRNTKVGRKVINATCYNAHSFKVKRSRSPHRLLLRLKVYHIYQTGRPTNFKLGMRYQLPWQTNKGQCSWVIAYRIGRTRDGHTTCLVLRDGFLLILSRTHVNNIKHILFSTVTTDDINIWQ